MKKESFTVDLINQKISVKNNELYTFEKCDICDETKVLKIFILSMESNVSKKPGVSIFSTLMALLTSGKGFPEKIVISCPLSSRASDTFFT